MPHLRKSGNRCPSRKRVIKLISDQVWSTDISYVPLEHGFMYLYAMIDVYSRYVLGWRLSPCKDVPNGCINRKKCLFNCRIFGRGIEQGQRKLLFDFFSSQHSNIFVTKILENYPVFCKNSEYFCRIILAPSPSPKTFEKIALFPRFFRRKKNAANRLNTRAKAAVLLSKYLKIIEHLQKYNKIFARFILFLYLCSRLRKTQRI